MKKTKKKRKLIFKVPSNENIERWNFWRLLERHIDDPEIYTKNAKLFRKKRFYFGAGNDARYDKYSDWDMCDLRDIEGTIKYDVLVGFPYGDNVLEEVKTKLVIGMFTYHQARFVVREIARCLQVGGIFKITFRNFDRLKLRQDELKHQMFNRYIYGSRLYDGSQRKSCWTVDAVEGICKEFAMELSEKPKHTGMNSTLVFERLPKKKLKAYKPEPKLVFDEDGNFVNTGGDFTHA